MMMVPATTQIEEEKKRKEMDIFETLLSPLNLAGRFSLTHRVVLAPVTRCRALKNVPHAAHVEYYSQRATPGGLLITEAVAVAQQGIGFPHSPGIFNEKQIEGWKRVVDVVHRKGAIIFCQLWHVGRASHTYYQPEGGPPLSSTSQGISQRWKIKLPREEEGEEEDLYSIPRALTRKEIHNVVQQFRRAAKNAIAAGFDGVEIHGGHGYLIDQFFKDNINDRNDEYGGSIANRCRFGLEVVSAVVEEVGCDRTAIRISPEIDHLDAHDSDPLALGLHLISRLNHLHLAYLHLTEPRFTAQGINAETSHFRLWPYRHAFEGIIMMSGGYTRESGMEAIQCGYADLVSYGRLFISNPDLPIRFALQAHLNPYDRSTFYTHHPVKGYTDYPFIDFLALQKDINIGMQATMAISKDIDDGIDITKPAVCRQCSIPQSSKSSLPLTSPTLTRSSSRRVF